MQAYSAHTTHLLHNRYYIHSSPNKQTHILHAHTYNKQTHTQLLYTDTDTIHLHKYFALQIKKYPRRQILHIQIPPTRGCYTNIGTKNRRIHHTYILHIQILLAHLLNTIKHKTHTGCKHTKKNYTQILHTRTHTSTHKHTLHTHLYHTRTDFTHSQILHTHRCYTLTVTTHT